VIVPSIIKKNPPPAVAAKLVPIARRMELGLNCRRDPAPGALGHYRVPVATTAAGCIRSKATREIACHLERSVSFRRAPPGPSSVEK
jgi:hypothetical protein